MRYFCFILAVINLTSGAVYIKGKCPDVKGMNNFDLEKFGQGTWYGVKRYPNDLEKQGECPMTTILKENGRHRFRTVEIVDGEKIPFDGYYDLSPDAGNTGIVSIHGLETPVEDLDHLYRVHIIDSDYDNYAIGFECTYNPEKDTGHVYAWVMTRNRNVEGDIKKKLDDAIKATGYIDNDKLITLHHTDEYCKAKHA